METKEKETDPRPSGYLRTADPLQDLLRWQRGKAEHELLVNLVESQRARIQVVEQVVEAFQGIFTYVDADGAVPPAGEPELPEGLNWIVRTLYEEVREFANAVVTYPHGNHNTEPGTHLWLITEQARVLPFLVGHEAVPQGFQDAILRVRETLDGLVERFESGIDARHADQENLLKILQFYRTRRLPRYLVDTDYSDVAEREGVVDGYRAALKEQAWAGVLADGGDS
jgi:hypothetical protein